MVGVKMLPLTFKKDAAPATLGLEGDDWLGDVVRQAIGRGGTSALTKESIEEVAKSVASRVASEVIDSLTQSVGTTVGRQPGVQGFARGT